MVTLVKFKDLFVFFLILFYTFNHIHADDKPRPKLKKNPEDFTENDVNNLFEQWEVIFNLFSFYKLNNDFI